MWDEIRSFRDLEVWRHAMALVEDVFRLTAGFPAQHRFGSSMQMQRSATSIPANVAEGAGRRGPAEFRRFLHIAQGSANELRTQLEIAVRLELPAEPAALMNPTDRVARMQTGLIRASSIEERMT